MGLGVSSSPKTFFISIDKPSGCAAKYKGLPHRKTHEHKTRKIFSDGTFIVEKYAE
jgi:hypothetical protein